MTKNRTPTQVYLDPGMHSGLEVKGLKERGRLNALSTVMITIKMNMPIIVCSHPIIDCQVI